MLKKKTFYKLDSNVYETFVWCSLWLLISQQFAFAICEDRHTKTSQKQLHNISLVKRFSQQIYLTSVWFG